jgi:sulfatase modifying factor 1
MRPRPSSPFRPAGLWLALAVLAAAPAGARQAPPPAGMARVAGGTYSPLYRDADGEGDIAVAPFYLDRTAVTNGDFLAFVRANPQWRRSRARRLFAEEGYLAHWAGDLAPGGAGVARQPVVNVSWFAATAYARWRGRRLPTVAEWEVAAMAGLHGPDGRREPAHLRRIAAWYGRPRPAVLPAVAQTPANHWGVRDLHGLVFEWTADFNSALASSDSRRAGDADTGAFCGAGAVGAGDFEDYAAFLRSAYRGGLRARYVVPNLGFRTALGAR